MGCSQTLTKEDKNAFKDKDQLVKKIKDKENISKAKEEEIEEEENKLLSKKKEIKNEENLSLSKEEDIKDEEKLSLSKEENIKDEESKSLSKKEENKKDEENKSVSKEEEIKDEDNKSLSMFEKIKRGIFVKEVFDIFAINSFIQIGENPLKKYTHFTNYFNNCNYIFIVKESLSNAFSSLYSKILKDALIFFPKDFQQTKELLNDYENEVGNKENWIVISPCIELEKNIQIYHNNTNIYRFIGYCPIMNHIHNYDILNKFSKFYGIMKTSVELIERLFKLNHIFYYRKKQKYEIDKDTEVIELKYDTNFVNVNDFKNDCSKNNVIFEKLYTLYDYKILNDECYFSFINSLTFILAYMNKSIKDNNLIMVNVGINLLKLTPMFQKPIKSIAFSINFFKNLHILYLYFSNYPYVYGILSDEEIEEILSTFYPNMEKYQLEINFVKFNIFGDIVNELSSQVEQGFSILSDKERLKILHHFLIKFDCSIEQLKNGYNIKELSQYYQIKNFYRDIAFCLGKFIMNIFKNYIEGYPFSLEIFQHFLNFEKRFLYYLGYYGHLKQDKYIENEEDKIYNKSLKYKHIIVLGDQDFHYLIKKINLPCEEDKQIYYFNEHQFSTFFQKPIKINKKYNVCKYIIIMNEKNWTKYYETIMYISNVFVIKILLIIYIQNKDIKIDKIHLQFPSIALVLVYSEKDILNYFNDINKSLKDIEIKYREENKMLEQKNKINYKFPKLSETKIIKEQDNGWDMIRNIDSDMFSLSCVNIIGGYIDIRKFYLDSYDIYKENNCLDLFINYYGNYFGADYLVENQISRIAYCKMFLYAYTLEENNGKSFYSIINNDFRSGNSEKICRYLSMIRTIYDLIRTKRLKSYSGDVYRATYFKKELIEEIKPGKKMMNASLWSSSKLQSVAMNFLLKYKKNILLHTKIKEGNNIDIDLEKLSKYPNEKEILFLPYCYFEIKSFEKAKENGYEYYKLELIYCKEENINNKIENVKSKDQFDEFKKNK